MPDKLWRFIWIILATILLVLTFLNFSPSMSGAVDILSNIHQIINIVEIEAEPAITEIKVRVLEADMGFSKKFLGNETEYELRPIRGALVLVMDGAAITTGPSYILRASYFGFTNEDGEVILLAPRGNFTLMINPRPYNRDPDCFWRGPITVDGNETIVAKFFLYRLNPTKVYVGLKARDPKTSLSLRFQLPLNGSYYVGIPIIAYYTSLGDAHLYREDAGGSFRLQEAVRNLWMNPRIYYLMALPGGTEVVRTVEIGGLAVYVSPQMTYLPVERVVVEELE